MTPRAMSPESPDASSKRKSLRNFLCLTVFLALLAGLSSPGAAQRFDGRNAAPNVIVDYSVLDELGRQPNVPQIMLENPTGAAYRNNPYRGQPRFPVVPKSQNRGRSNRLVLTPPAATPRRAARRPAARQPARRSAPPVVRRTPLAPSRPVVRRATVPVQQPTPRTPRRFAPPPPRAIVKAPPAIVVRPPPKMTPPIQRRTAPPEVKTVTARPKVPEPPPLPPVTTAPKPKPKPSRVVRRAVPPPPAPPKATVPPPPIVRKVVRSAPRPVVARPPPTPVRVTKPNPTRATSAKPKQVASLPRSPASVRSGSLRRIEFPAGTAKLNNKASLGLQNVAKALSKDPALRIELLAYAGQKNDSASQARRLSLSRALAARSKLIEQGVRSTRIDVRALGNKSAGGPADRIDIIVTKR